MRVAAITGSGRAFCTGLDLKVYRLSDPSTPVPSTPDTGFAGMSNRVSKEPIIAAVSGLCYGVGCEMAINADMITASHDSKSALAEVKVGTLACAGVLPRLILSVGLQRATEMTLTGRVIGVEEARDWGLTNKVVDKGSLVQSALDFAKCIVGNSPDSVIATREGIRKGWIGPEALAVNDKLYRAWRPHNELENYKEGIKAFSEKRASNWIDSKL